MALAILGMGTAVPPTCVTQKESLEIAKLLAEEHPELIELIERLYPKTTIQKRHIVHTPEFLMKLQDEPETSRTVAQGLMANGGPGTLNRLKLADSCAGPMAEEAASKALAEAGLQPQDVTHLITVSSTLGSAPGFDANLITRLGMSPFVNRTNVGLMMCQAALSGMRVANAFASSHEKAVVLMVALEVCSVHYDLESTPKTLVSNAVFSDGAAALVGSPQPDSDWQVDLSTGYLLDSEKDNLKVAYGDQGLNICLSTKVPQLIEKHVGEWLRGWLKTQNLEVSDIGSWAVHPGGPKILDAVETSLNLRSPQLQNSRDILGEFGNMSSPTVLFILDRLRKQNAKLPCVAMAFGPGLTIEAALIGRSAASGTRPKNAMNAA